MALTASDIDTSKTSQHTARLEKIGMALEALRNVIKGNPGLLSLLVAPGPFSDYRALIIVFHP